jgi:Bacterial Ig-like domain
VARALLLAVLAPALASAATTVLFSPFPSDSLTVADSLQKTGLRLNLAAADCAVQVTACREIALLNQSDGFSVRARAQVRFSGPIDPSTIPGGIFFLAVGDPSGQRITLDQAVFDPYTDTVYGKPASVLDQDRRYALIVTDAVTDLSGARVAADPAFTACLKSSDSYCAALAAAVAGAGAAPRQVVGASVFTTMSATAWLEHARDVVSSTPPVLAPAAPQSTFAIASLSTLVLHEQTGDNPARFSDVSLPVDSTLLAGLERVVIGSYQSPDFRRADQTIAPAPTAPALDPPANTNTVYFNALLPAAARKPAAGYPVVIFGHGFGDSRFGGPTAVAPALASAGFAVIAINAVGHGFGPLGTVTFTDKAGHAVTLPSGGRGVDLNGDGVIESNEGCALVTPIAYGTRDCFRQTVVDLMQLAHAIRLGLDLDGDGTPDLDAGRIYYAGQSLGAMYGTMFTAVEPDIRAAALNVGGGSTVDIARWSPAYRDFATSALGQRLPSLLNRRGGYDEDYVLPGQPPHVTTVPGAAAIQNAFENLEWLAMSGDPLAFAPHLAASPLAGAAARPVLVQFARADRTMPNPATTNLIKAAGLQSSTWEYRHDLARAKAPDLPLDPHPFLVLFASVGGGGIQLPGADAVAISIDAQEQVATFFAADGASIADPNILSPFFLGIRVFEKPSTLPADFGYPGLNGPGHLPVLRRTQ